MIGDVLQPTHLIFILVVALLVLGPKRLPEVGRSLGKGIRDFRGALSGVDDHLSPDATPPADAPPTPPMTPATTSIPAEVSTPEIEANKATPVAAPTPLDTQEAAESGTVEAPTVVQRPVAEEHHVEDATVEDATVEAPLPSGSHLDSPRP